MISKQPLSPRTASLHSRYADAECRHSVCVYCAVGCGLNIYVKNGSVVGIEGDESSPVNRGRLCPKGASTLQLVNNPHRVTSVLYRAPGEKQWQTVDTTWALERISTLLMESRERNFIEKNTKGLPVNHVKSVVSLGGSACENETNYLLKKLLCGGLGVLPIENQARL